MAYDRTNQISTMDLKAITGFVQTKFKELEGVAANDGLKSLDADGVKDFQARNEELVEARGRLKSLHDANEAYTKQQEEHKKSFQTPNRNVPFEGSNGGGNGAQGRNGSQGDNEFKSLGDLFTESAPYKSLDKDNLNLKVTGTLQSDIAGVSIKSVELSALKATMTTSAGWAPYPSISPRPPVLSALQKPLVSDLIPQDDTNQPAILWYEETLFGDNAAATAEGGTKPETSLGMTLQTQPVVKIAVMLPITDEQLQDVPQVRSYIDQRLTLMIKRAEEVELLGGSGVSPHLMGFHNKSGIGHTVRINGEDNQDAILRAITDVNNITGYADASAVILNPLQWLAIRLIRTTTGDYIWGHPALQGPATLWGLPVVSTNAQTDGRALVGDFNMYAHISRRLGVRIDVGFINDDFQKDIQRIRLEERLSLEIYRAAAFNEVTSLNKAA
jgi:hypothetical protein